MTDLLDSNVLTALCDLGHEHHKAARAWVDMNPRFAVCPITEGAVVRYVVRKSPLGSRAYERVLQIMREYEGYEFWPDDVSYQNAPLDRIRGHKQATDAYLVALAKAHGERLATLDRALAAVHPEAVLVPFS